jgi:serine/threonine protein kinase
MARGAAGGAAGAAQGHGGAAALGESLYAERAARFRSLREFHVRELIGRGGFGRVYRVELRASAAGAPAQRSTSRSKGGRKDGDNQVGNQITDLDQCKEEEEEEEEAPSGSRGSALALKVMKKKWLAERGLLGRAAQEVRLHLSLAPHPCVVTVHGYFEDQARAYLVLELCEGGNLWQELRRQRPVAPEQVCHWFRQIVRGVAYLHANDVVHRDLKLSNVLLTREGQCKVGDFGLAARIEDREHHTVCGTPNYMAPEVRGHDRRGGAQRPYDPVQADLWSLGCLLYALLHDGEHLEPGMPYRRSSRVVDDHAHALLKTLLSEREDRTTARDVLRHAYLRGGTGGDGAGCSGGRTRTGAGALASPVARSLETERLSVVRIDTGRVRGVQHVFGQHLVQILRDGSILVTTERQGQRRTISVGERMPARYSKLQTFCAKAVDILRANTPKVILKLATPEPMVCAVVDGVGRVWLLKRNLCATYDTNAETPAVTVGDRVFALDQVCASGGWRQQQPQQQSRLQLNLQSKQHSKQQHHQQQQQQQQPQQQRQGHRGQPPRGSQNQQPSLLAPDLSHNPASCGLSGLTSSTLGTGNALPRIVQDVVTRCLELEVDLHRKEAGRADTVFYPVIMNEDIVALEGVGTGIRSPDGDVSVRLQDGTSLSLNRTGSVVTLDAKDYALTAGAALPDLPQLPPHLRHKLRQARALIGQLLRA